MKEEGRQKNRRPLRDLVVGCRDLDIGRALPISFGPGRHPGQGEVYFTVAPGGQFLVLEDWKRWRK